MKTSAREGDGFSRFVDKLLPVLAPQRTLRREWRPDGSRQVGGQGSRFGSAFDRPPKNGRSRIKAIALPELFGDSTDEGHRLVSDGDILELSVAPAYQSEVADALRPSAL